MSKPGVPACLDCAACCQVFGIVEIDPVEDLVPRQLTTRTELGYRRMQTVGFRCVCLQPDWRCSIYDQRPRVCRNLRRGMRLCQMAVSQLALLETVNGVM